MADSVAINSVHNTALRVLREPASLDNILDYAPLPDVRSLGLISESFQGAVKYYLLRRVNALLGEWFKDPTQVRQIMDQTSTVVSGSVVLEFILATRWECSNLNLYTAKGDGCTTLVQHLTEVEGYSIISTWSAQPNIVNPSQLKMVYRLAKTTPVEGQDPIVRSIDVVESTFTHPLPPILRFHGTFAMNWISSDGIFVAYPHHTFAFKGLLCDRIPWNVESAHPKQLAWMSKYTARGFTMLRGTDDLGEPCGTDCPTVWRSTRDVACMVVPFEEGAAKEFQEIRWTLAWNGVERRRCRNPHCPRSKLNLDLRSQVPEEE